MLSLFSNIYINDFRNLKNSIRSFRSLPHHIFSRFVINIRGKYAYILKQYIIKKLKNKKIHKKILISSFESGISWKFDSSLLIRKIETKYIFIWIEDHICIDKKLFLKTANDAIISDLDVICYSFHNFDFRKKEYKNFKRTKLNNLTIFEFNSDDISKISFDYLISLISIQKIEIFKKILHQPIKNFNYRLSPLEAEIPPKSKIFHKIRKGFFNKNFFFAIDDDHTLEKSCLISKGLYPPYSRESNFFKEYNSPINRTITYFRVRFYRLVEFLLCNKFILKFIDYREKNFILSIKILFLFIKNKISYNKGVSTEKLNLTFSSEIFSMKDKEEIKEKILSDCILVELFNE